MKSVRNVCCARGLRAGRHSSYLILVLVTLIAVAQCPAQSNGIIARGWHPWYEVKVDPSDRTHLLICGSRWDSEANALVGFVYRSVDSGQTWRVALEDKSTTWVSEHSCSVGSDHMMYFISEASDVVEGMPNHRRGTARLYVSADGGGKWEETLKTGWADWTTSAVSLKSGMLAIFFHYTGVTRQEESAGSNVGLLTVSKDGKRIAGPFVNAEIIERNYQGVYPSNALSLRDGTVVALYYGRRPSAGGFDLGLVRAIAETGGPLQFAEIAHSAAGSKQRCFSGLGDYGLAYDEARNRLVAAYRDEKNGKCGLMIAISEDSGETWDKQPLLGDGNAAEVRPFKISVAVNSYGELGVLWSEGAGRWRFATAGNAYVLRQPLELWAGRKPLRISNDALWTVVSRSPALEGTKGTETSLTVNVRSLPGRVWRGSGLVAVNESFYAVGLTGDGIRQDLQGAAVGNLNGLSPAETSVAVPPVLRDVTQETNLIYGGRQSFDESTGTLALDVQLVNHGGEPLPTPVYMVAENVQSDSGRVTILNADNGVRGPGASWDLSKSVTGNQIPPGATMFNSFRLLFHIDYAEKMISTNGLLSLNAKILCGATVSAASAQ